MHGSRHVDDRYDIVFFWKQNDTGIYGRRQDMLVKYLSRSPRVNKIIHFDAPIDAVTLLHLDPRRRVDKTDSNQSSLVFHQTVSRLLGQKDSEKVKYHTFVSDLEARRNGLEAPSPTGRGLPERSHHLQYVADVLKENGIRERKTIFWVCPTTKFDFREFVSTLAPDLVVADVIDDQRTWEEPGSPRRAALERNYQQILSLSDVVLTNCEPVRQSMLKYSDDIRLVPNALELPEAVAADTDLPKELEDLEGPVLGYVGNLSSRIDIELLEYVATSRPAWNLVLIGSVHLSKEILKLDVYDNVHFLGVKKYHEAQQYIRSFDVAIVPHLNNEMTQYMNPLKVFVYFSLNVPTVSTEIENLGELRELIYVARDQKDFVRKVELALEQRSDSLSADHMELLRQNSWEERVKTILGLIEEELSATLNLDSFWRLPEEKAISATTRTEPEGFGYCEVCGHIGMFQQRQGSIREGYKCSNCSASLRYRHQAAVIISKYTSASSDSFAELAKEPAFQQLHVYEPGIVGPFRKYFKEHPNYTTSYLWDNVEPGDSKDGVRCENLERLTFDDESFDLVISSDIFEHVRKPYEAFSEIYRVLKPGGMHVFTVPLNWPLPENAVSRVDTSGAEDVFVLPEVYHGSPTASEGSLVYTDFGLDLVDDLENIGFKAEVHRGVRYNVTFCAEK